MPVEEPERNLNLRVNGTFYNNYLSVKLDKYQNKSNSFSAKVIGEKESNDDFEKGNIIRIYSGNDEIFKGKISEVSFSSEDLTVTIKGNGMEYELMKRLADRNKYQYENTPVNTIVDKVLSEDGSGGSPYIIKPGVNDITNPTSFRGEFDKKLPILKGLANAVNLEWWIDQDSQDTDRFNLTNRKGSSASVKTFSTSGSDFSSSNIKRTRNEKDLANVVTATGAGDGENQYNSFAFHATTIRTTLDENLTADGDSGIEVEDASDFPDSGVIFIGCEKISYSGKSGDTLGSSSVTRQSSDSTENIGAGIEVDTNESYRHNKGGEVYLYTDSDTGTTYDLDNPQEGSALYDNGEVKEAEVTNRNIIDQDTLDRMTQTYLSEHKDVIQEITVESVDPLQDLYDVRIGDTCTIDDDDTGISREKFRCVEMNLNYDIEKEPTLKLIFGRKTSQFTQRIRKNEDDTKNLNVYMQGSTSSFNVQQYENCDSDNPLELRFFLPEDVIAINKALLKYKVRDYRAYINNYEDHTHNVDSFTSKSSDTSEYIAMGSSIYSVGATADASSDEQYYQVAIKDPQVGDFSGAVITGDLINKTGSEETYNLSFRNESTDTELYSTSVTLDNNESKTINYHAETDEVNVGHIVRFSVTDGKIGTQSEDHSTKKTDTKHGHLIEGEYTQLADGSVGDHQHEIDGVGTNNTDTEHSHNLTLNGYRTLGHMTISVQTDSEHKHDIEDQTAQANTDLAYKIDTSKGGSSEEPTIEIGPDSTFDSDAITISEGDITEQLKNFDKDQWIIIKFTPDNPCRIEANAFIKHWIHSKS